MTMSRREFDQLEVLLGVQSDWLRVTGTCTVMGRSRRQVFRLLQGMREAGAASLVFRRSSNRGLPEATPLTERDSSI